MVDADAVAGAIKDGEFYGTVSAERASELDSDVLVTWVEKASDVQTLTDDELVGRVPAIASGHLYAESDKTVAMASTNPTPLSIPVVIDTFVPKVAAAVAGS